MYQVLAADRYKEPFKVQGEAESLEEARRMAQRFTEEHPSVCHERDIHIYEEGRFLEYAGPHHESGNFCLEFLRVGRRSI